MFDAAHTVGLIFRVLGPLSESFELLTLLRLVFTNNQIQISNIKERQSNLEKTSKKTRSFFVIIEPLGLAKNLLPDT